MTGTTVLGCKYKDGVMIACDTLGASRTPEPARDPTLPARARAVEISLLASGTHGNPKSGTGDGHALTLARTASSDAPYPPRFLSQVRTARRSGTSPSSA